MRNLRWPFLIICLLTLMILIPAVCLAQPGDPGNPDSPITGIEVLLGIGGFLGIKKLYNSRKGRKD
jgi:hypothetical protein